VARAVLAGFLLAGSLSTLVALSLPPRAAHVAGPTRSSAIVVPGAFHVHTTRSDGAGSIDDVARAAAKAGLRFVVVTDHGDGTRPASPPSYRSGVLIIDGVEISTTGGHYAAAGMPAAPYPLSGEARDVADDVRRLGGIGVVAHGDSRKPDLRWDDWSTPFDGLEWLNFDSEWRGRSRLQLARALAGYFIRGPETLASLMARPAATLRRWDDAASHRNVFAISASDAHGGLPAYDECFRTATTRLELAAPLGGDAEVDAASILAALRSGHHYSVVDALAIPGTFSFVGRQRNRVARQGDTLAEGEPLALEIHADLPPGARIVLLRDGVVVSESRQRHLLYQASGDRAAYRVEVRLQPEEEASVPWVVSNPIYVGARTPIGPATEVPIGAATEVMVPGDSLRRWSTERDRSSDAVSEHAGAGSERQLVFRYSLGDGFPAAQFAALVGVIASGALSRFDRLTFTASADRPLRMAVELRPAGTDNPPRWMRSVYLDRTSRAVTIGFDDMRATTGSVTTRVPLNAIDALMFVIDTNNTVPGTRGEIRFSRIAFAAKRAGG
jgi:hypothetical protein